MLPSRSGNHHTNQYAAKHGSGTRKRHFTLLTFPRQVCRAHDAEHIHSNVLEEWQRTPFKLQTSRFVRNGTATAKPEGQKKPHRLICRSNSNLSEKEKFKVQSLPSAKMLAASVSANSEREPGRFKLQSAACHMAVMAPWGLNIIIIT